MNAVAKKLLMKPGQCWLLFNAPENYLPTLSPLPENLQVSYSAQGKFVTTAFVEGPYGYQSFQSYGTVMLFAAGVGITHQVPHVRDLVAA